jgi:hypothetical protein
MSDTENFMGYMTCIQDIFDHLIAIIDMVEEKDLVVLSISWLTL